jgi:AraC-like DNA-binding protein
VDPITDVFTAMHVESVVYGRVELSAPWGLRLERGDYACFGMIARGNTWLSAEGLHQPIPLSGGDCFCLFAQSHVHTLTDEPGAPATNMGDVVQNKCDNVIRFGGGGVPTTIIGGRFTFDRSNSKPLTDLLPAFIIVRSERAQALPLHQTLQLFAAEAADYSLGADLVLKRLADIFLLQVIREHISSKACHQTGWLRALSDPRIGGVLRSMHEKVERPWTVAELASVAGMSRSAFALRFKHLVGETPLEYLTRWRIYKSVLLLREGDKKLADVANAVGYDSEGSFNKTFKRIVGITPGAYRRTDRSPTATLSEPCAVVDSSAFSSY